MPHFLVLLVMLISACGGGDEAVDVAVAALVRDLTTRAAAFEVVATVEGTATQATSAPNGRIELVVPAAAPDPATIVFSRADLLVTRATVKKSVTGPLLLPMVSSAADADALATNLGIPRDPADTLLLADFLTTNGPATGTTVNLSGNDGAFFHNSFEFMPGNVVDSIPTILFVNQSGTTARIDSEPACDGPDEAALEPGGLTYVPFHCGE
jgi:hypothetical protein